MGRVPTFNECFVFSEYFIIRHVYSIVILELGDRATGVQIIGWNMLICVLELQH